jgi:hypothetical protein
MNWSAFFDWAGTTPIYVVAGVVLVLMTLAALGGAIVRNLHDRGRGPGARPKEESVDAEIKAAQEGYLVSAVLGLLALLMGFTFALAVDRFETRRGLVLEEANAIGTAYLRTQLLEAPHRERIAGLLVDYVDNRLVLAHADPGAIAPLVQKNDRMITDLWAATSAAFPSIKGLDFSSTYLESMNSIVAFDAARKTAYLVRVPGAVFGVLIFYMIVTAAVLGYVLLGMRGRLSAVFMLLLFVLSLALVLDIDRPKLGVIQETQAPMEDLQIALRSWPGAVFDRWRDGPNGDSGGQ